jgi:glycosyltransferase involved in cell wall biosynthesis
MANILHVVNVSFVLPYYLGDQIDYFKEKGDSIFIACSPSQNLNDFCEKKKIPFVPIPVIRGINPISDIYAIIKLIIFIKKNKIDVIVGHTPKGGLLAMLAGNLSFIRRKIYFRHGLLFETTHGVKRFFLFYIEKLTGLLSDKVVCVSNSILQISNQLKLNSKKKNVLLSNGTCNGLDALNKFNPVLVKPNIISNTRLKLGLNESDFIVGFVGRIVKDKGIPELIDAWKLIKIDFPNIKLLLVGPFESRDGMSFECVEFIKNEKSIIHIDYTTETVLYYSLMDIFILPSYREGFPTVVLEASAMTLPIITTKKTGCIDSIIENLTGVFCEIDTKSIYDTIKKFMNDPSAFKKMGYHGRERVISDFSQEIIWSELYNLFHE